MQSGDRRAQRTDPPVVELETSPGAGVFEADERIRVERVHLGSDDRISTATLAVRLDDDFDVAAARQRYLPDLAVRVRTAGRTPNDGNDLFHGFLPEHQASWRGGPTGAEDRLVLEAVGVYDRLSTDPRSWIVGRRMRNGEILDGLAVDPATWAGRSVCVEALPCVFNLDGAPNCDPAPLTMTAGDGSARSIHIFTYDGDPAAVSWTYLRVLRYLFTFYAPADLGVGEGNVFSATDAYADFGPDVLDTQRPASALIAALLAAPASMNCEATNLVEALVLLGDAGGVHITAETDNETSGPMTRLRVWASGESAAKPLPLAPGGTHPDGQRRFDGAALPAGEVLAANQVAAARIAWQHRAIVNAPLVTGGVRAYEMTLPLLPGWLPTTDLDNVAAPDRPAAKAMALTPAQVTALGGAAADDPWFKKYHRDGSQFITNREVARFWVVNDDGRFDGATYNRNPPFDDYRAFDFATVVASQITRPGAWARRTRPLLSSITKTELGSGFGVFVEVSFDGGTTWSVPTGPVTVRTGPTGIWFGTDNPTRITPPGVAPEAQNMWLALIDQTFRVRVTAVVESDERLSARPAPSERDTPTLRLASRLVYRPSQYRFTSRENTTSVLASVNPSAADIGRDDTEAVITRAARIADREAARQVTATVEIPWIDTTLAIGDAVSGVDRRGVGFAGSEGRDAKHPVVIGQEFEWAPSRRVTRLLLAHTDTKA